MTQPTRETTYIEVAKLISQRGTCGRMKVGCIITKNNRIISSGYNGPLSSESPCEMNCNTLEACEHSVHAEENAIMNAAQLGINLFMTTLYCTHSPCVKCARQIVQAGISKIVYLETYRDILPFQILKRADIEVIKYEPFKGSNQTI